MPGSTGEDEIEALADDGAAFGVNDILMDYFVGGGEVVGADRAAELVASAVGPMKTGFFVFEDVAGDDGFVVAADGDFGDVAHGSFVAEGLAHLGGRWAVANNVNDLIVLDDEEGGFIVVADGDAAVCLAVGRFVGDDEYFAGGEISEAEGVFAGGRMQAARMQ